VKNIITGKQEVSMEDRIERIVNDLDRAVKSMKKIIGAGIRKEFKSLPDQYVEAVADVAIKDRALTDTEKMVYVMSYFEFGEALQEIAKEHKRNERLVMATIREAVETKNKWVEYFFDKGISRGKVGPDRLSVATVELNCSIAE